MSLEFKLNTEDINWSDNFAAINALLTRCKEPGRATLLLSTCRNAYLTANALFRDLQIILNGASPSLSMRSGLEMLAEGRNPERVKEHFARSVQTVREFESKRRVWSERKLIAQDIESARDNMLAENPGQSHRVDLILKNVRAHASDGWERELLSFDLSERPELATHFEWLDKIFKALLCAAELGWNTAVSLEKFEENATPRLDLGDQRKKSKDEKSIRRVLMLVEDLTLALDWSMSKYGNGITVKPLTGYMRPQNSLDLDKELIFADLSTVDTIQREAKKIATLIRESLFWAHSQMCSNFQANISKPPFPTPFEIVLPLPDPKFEKGHVATPQIKRIRCASTDAPRTSVKIAIANLRVPLEELRKYQLLTAAAEVAKQDIRLALHTAEQQGCHAIAFPEYSVPASMKSEILDLSKRHNLVIVAGLEGQWIEGTLADEAIVAIPSEAQCHGQYKQEPSAEEPNRDSFYRDGYTRLFTNSPIGDFAVTVCSDFLQMSNLHAWTTLGPLPEIIFVIARNDYPDLYLNFAKSDSVRLYSAIVIANIHQAKQDKSLNNLGSCVVIPHRKEQVVIPTEVPVKGHFLQNLSVNEISLWAIRGRTRGKPETDYFNIPAWAKRS
jgi:hypothetical protein